MNKTNYQLLLDRILSNEEAAGRVPTLLLHSCCAPCSSYSIEYLSQHFLVTVFYFNPNISPVAEYRHRVAEQQRLISEMPTVNPVSFIEGEYDPRKFYEASHGLEHEPEGGLRCTECFRLRLGRTAQIAAERGFDYFTTTLTISPMKDAVRLNAIGEEMGRKYGIAFLPSDFKKRGGYLRSIELSRQYGLYRQNFCGCVFSRQEAERRAKAKAGSEAETEKGGETGK